MRYSVTHRLFDDIGPFRWDSVFGVLLKEPAQILQRRSKGSTDLQSRSQETWTRVHNTQDRYFNNIPKISNFCVPFLRKHLKTHYTKEPHWTQTHLACISPVDDLDPLLSCEAVHVDLVGVSAAVPLLFGPTVLEVELHLHLIYPLDRKWNIFQCKIKKYLTAQTIINQKKIIHIQG